MLLWRIAGPLDFSNHAITHLLAIIGHRETPQLHIRNRDHITCRWAEPRRWGMQNPPNPLAKLPTRDRFRSGYFRRVRAGIRMKYPESGSFVQPELSGLLLFHPNCVIIILSSIWVLDFSSVWDPDTDTPGNNTLKFLEKTAVNTC